ncbi:hypothetical protein BT67DRAFT_452232 [Trichocladium antarcticum]|uniref:Uncharacterized protein n=1 Tax=Trichocladium antarcticum TaxID=1450529 RepID=A0AAN6UDR8_9PEZI|nr:hypothetical protein BT67DRAFT_452232 [Trichocladium antarcticum]
MDSARKPKRKRGASPSAVINPLSHRPATLKQFTLAGYPPELPLPAETHPGFPHRAPRDKSPSPTPTTSDDDDDDDDDGDDDDGNNTSARDATTDAETTDADADADADTDATTGSTRRRNKAASRNRTNKEQDDRDRDRKAAAYRARVGWLTAIIRRCLGEGDVATATRAFGLLARARVYGRKVDLRGDGDGDGDEGEGGGEGDGNGDGEEEVDEEREAARLERLKTYYGYLIQQYPYSKQHPRSTNVELDFHVALYSAEMEAAYAAHGRGLERLQRGDSWGGDDEDAMDVDEDMGFGADGGDGVDHEEASGRGEHLQGLSRHELKLREKENGLRLVALRSMTDIAERMDTAMETVPFSRGPELLRLRAMVALYLGDLNVPPAPRSKAEDKASKRARAGQRCKARDLLRKIKEGGGELKDHDEQLLESLESDDEDEDGDEDEGPALPM